MAGALVADGKLSMAEDRAGSRGRALDAGSELSGWARAGVFYAVNLISPHQSEAEYGRSE